MAGTSSGITGYDAEMELGRAALAARDFRTAYRHFGRAHDIGHDVLALHLGAHRSLLATAWAERRAGRAAKQLLLLAVTPLFNWNTPNRRQAVASAGGTKRWT
jgi:hypothetical protein